jgi:hypothetical protein
MRLRVETHTPAMRVKFHTDKSLNDAESQRFRNSCLNEHVEYSSPRWN